MQLEIDDFVLARMRGYGPWPAKIISFTKDKRRARCYFYGSNDNGSVEVKEIIPFKSGFDTIRLIKIRKPTNFIKGVQEVEILNGIPKHLSSLRDELSIE